MQVLKTIVRIIEAILLLLIPLAMFYWFFSSINLAYIKPFAALLGTIFNPAIAMIKPYFHYTVRYEGTTVSFDPLFLAIIMIVLFFVFSGVEKILEGMEELFQEAGKKVKASKEKKQEEFLKIKHIENMERNKITYFVLKFKKKETKNAYLYSGSEDLFTGGILNTMINDTVAKAKDYRGKYEKPKEADDPNIHNIVFYDIDEAIDYAFYVHNRVKEINKEVLDQGEKLHYCIVCHCAQTEVTAKVDRDMIFKMLNLSGDNEILVSELFKSKYDAQKEESNLVFSSKGIYIMNNEQVEIFALKAG